MWKNQVFTLLQGYVFKYLDPDTEQQYSEVYAEKMRNKNQGLSLMEKQVKEEELVWEACVR